MAYKVVYDEKNCTAANRCMNIQPKLWKLGGGKKAVLEGGQLNQQTGKYERVIEDKDFEAYKETALICPSYVIDIVDTKTGKSVLNIRPTKPNEKENVPVLKAHYDSRKEWKMDPKGFFTIKPFPEESIIRVRYYDDTHALKLVIEGKTAEEIYNTIVRDGLVSLPEHAAYLGSELQKAEIAMKKNLPYIQDDPLP